MAVDMAKALFAKIVSDEKLREEFAKVKDEQSFVELAKKYGYACTLEEFQKAKETGIVDGAEVGKETLSQTAGGLSMVGVDYAFTAVKCS